MFPIPTPGAIGSIETPENEIRILAERSHSYVCPKCKATEKILPPRQCVVCSTRRCVVGYGTKVSYGDTIC